MQTVNVFEIAVGKFAHVDASCKRLLSFSRRRSQIIDMSSPSFRCIASANIADAWNLPLHYLNGKRVQPINSNRTADITVSEPATGKYIAFNVDDSRNDSDSIKLM